MYCFKYFGLKVYMMYIYDNWSYILKLMLIHLTIFLLVYNKYSSRFIYGFIFAMSVPLFFLRNLVSVSVSVSVLHR